MQRYDFNRWLSMYQVRKGLKSLSKQSWRESYAAVERFFYKRRDVRSLMAVDSERSWYENGQPYYKVWPAMSQALANVSIDIDGLYLKMPFNCFEVCFAKGLGPRESPTAPEVKSLLVHRSDRPEHSLVNYERPGKERDWTLIVHYQFDLPKEDFMGYIYAFGIKHGQTIEERWADAWGDSTHYEDALYQPSKEFTHEIVRTAVAVAFFGVHDHQMIMPDIPNRWIEKYHRARREKRTEEEKKLLEKAKGRGHFGWRIGSEIDLPQPIVNHVTVEGERGRPGRELQFGHVRSGHMRLQPYGPKDKPSHYELIFLAPTMVRADLPIRDIRGFRIRDDLLTRRED